MAEFGCTALVPANAPCPTEVDALAQAARASMPPGWAWDSADIPGTLLYALTWAWAGVLKQVSDRACELLPEFVCHTVNETRPEWEDDFGLPDDCGIDDLCAKVAATGGANCAYFTDLGHMLGYDICCQDLAPEIHTGCWDLGCATMPPAPKWAKGGFELGFAGLGHCPPDDDGSYLGDDDPPDTDCYISGYRRRTPSPVEPPNPCDLKAQEWWPKSEVTFATGCHEPIELTDYVGTAYHWIVGLTTDAVIEGDVGHCDPHPGVGDPGWEVGISPFGTYVPPETPYTSPYAMMGCMEIGCSALCTPVTEPVFCFIEKLRPAHVVPIRRYCENL